MGRPARGVEAVNTITLRCWACGASKPIQIEKPIEFGFQLYDAAYANDWVAGMDRRFCRCLVFCCDQHLKASLTKAGYFRARPPKL